MKRLMAGLVLLGTLGAVSAPAWAGSACLELVVPGEEGVGVWCKLALVDQQAAHIRRLEGGTSVQFGLGLFLGGLGGLILWGIVAGLVTFRAQERARLATEMLNNTRIHLRETPHR